METYRCFIAVDLPSAVKLSLTAAQLCLKAAKDRIKWVEEVNFHLTLKYLGEITQAQVEAIQETLKSIANHHRKSGFYINGAGAFPNPRNPKIIWAVIRDSENTLTGLHQEIDDELFKLGLPREQKKFSPHLTLGRVKDPGPVPGLSGLLQDLKVKEFVALEEFKLMRSKLTKNGPEYSTISSFELQEHF